MAVLHMQRVYIYGLKKQRKQLLEWLQRLGMIEINDVLLEDDVFHKEDVVPMQVVVEKNIAVAKSATQILSTFLPEKKRITAVLNGRTQRDAKAYDAFGSEHESMLGVAKAICELEKLIAECKAEKLKVRTQLEMLGAWQPLDIPIHFSGTRKTNSFIGVLPGNWSTPMIEEKLPEGIPVSIELVSASKEQTCVFVLCMKGMQEIVFETLRSIGFSYPDSSLSQIPQMQSADLEKKLDELVACMRSSEEKMMAYNVEKENLYLLEDYNHMRSEKYQALGKLAQSNNVFVMTGYIPEIASKGLEQALNKRFEAVVTFEEPKEDEEVPVLLKNNSFARPLESTVDAFSPPGKHEVDPTMVMALFYYALFGLMLSDAAYGLIMVLGCGFVLWKFKKTLEEPMRNTLKMFLFCGISTIFWGVMFGSYFGDLLDIVTATFFGHKVTIPPLWFFPVNEPMRMLVFCMLLGVIHLFTGLGMKLYLCIKQKDYKAVIYDVVLWYVLLISSILILLSMALFVDTMGLGFILPKQVGDAAGICAIISAIGITLTNGRESKNPFKRFLKGLYALYGITGYLSDVLSYSRLLALGLATGVICTVINKMASMTAGGPIGILIFIVICIFGHLMNMAINALGAYVHTNRLQYVEFFGKFYEGGGRKFNPFSAKTNYYRFKEELENE